MELQLFKDYSKNVLNLYSRNFLIELGYPEEFINNFSDEDIKNFYPVAFPFKDLDLNGKNIIDIGCGAGLDIIFALKNRANIVLGIDICFDLLKNIKYLNDILKINGDIENLEFSKECFFHVAIFNGSFNQIIKKFSVLKKIKTLLKKDGIIIICDIFWEGKVCEKKIYENDFSYWLLNIGGSLTEKEFLNIAEKVDLKLVDLEILENYYPVKRFKVVLKK